MIEAPKGIIVNKGFYPHIIRNILRRYWYFPILTLGFFYVVGYFYLRYTKAVYESNSVIQISDQDQSKEVIGIDNAIAAKDISAEIQFLSSPFLFEKAINKLNLKVSAYAQGKILTEDLYNKSSYKINLLQLTDSTILDKPIFIKSIEGSTIALEYTNGNKKSKIYGKINNPIICSKFQVFISVPNYNSFIASITSNKVFFYIQ